ncbi:hypothetical protein CAPTEDRAFT_188109 [Capitella teleta]|uniref:Uncharacterized protein n=1 Tax=Capitella teleta TaxID=283909 RepID=R7V6N1_CAPTE|nr:hypothetical protein CAPTEDRAFT_188109 [Capitella teleta]|eukprot:ELU12026.1 hypothetical protein CAPTEDRAFT_188109 [Capitella teleta]
MVEGDKPVSMSELDRALQQLKCGKAMDDSGVVGEYVRGLGERGRQALREEFNVILRDGVVPEEWRRSRVALLSKGGDRRVVLNYRPVAIIMVMDLEWRSVKQSQVCVGDGEVRCPFLVARERWKNMMVCKAMYGAGAIVWKRAEAKSLEVMQSEFGRWLWRVDMSVRNAAVQGESGWSTFEEREVKAKMAFVRKILWGGGLVAEVGRAALLEIGLQSGLWKEVESMGLRFHWDELAHLICRRRVSETGREMRGVGEDWIRDMTKEKMNERVMEVGKEEWKRLLQSTELTRRYGEEERDCVCGEEERDCVCGEEERDCVWRETEEHVLLDCVRYEHLRGEWRERWREEKGNQDMMEGDIYPFYLSAGYSATAHGEVINNKAVRPADRRGSTTEHYLAIRSPGISSSYHRPIFPHYTQAQKRQDEPKHTLVIEQVPNPNQYNNSFDFQTKIRSWDASLIQMINNAKIIYNDKVLSEAKGILNLNKPNSTASRGPIKITLADTADFNHLPSYGLKIGWEIFNAEQWLSSPSQCFKCQRSGYNANFATRCHSKPCCITEMITPNEEAASVRQNVATLKGIILL